MSLGEFDLIERYFRRPAAQRPARGVALGIGDDCALLAPAEGQRLAVSSDMLVEGRHFLSTVDPQRLGHKALAVNLSDLAACGARPLGFTLAMALPQADAAWLEAFARGLFTLADRHGCALVGGDTTRGPLNLCITVFGEVGSAPGEALLRSGARAGEALWVSGTLGDARLALEAFRGHISLPGEVFERARLRMEQPEPRVALGQALRGLASAAVDVSDGLLGDIGHVLHASGVGLRVDAAAARSLLAESRQPGWDDWRAGARLDDARWLDLVLAGGDDYELAFTAPADAADAVRAAAAACGTPVSCIGRIEAESGVRVVEADGRPVLSRFASFDHFA